MSVKVLKTEGLTCELEVTVPAAEIQAVKAMELARVGQNVALPGFRKGKVPAHVLETKYGQAVMADVLERAVQQSSAKAIQDNNLRPALQPKVEVKSFDMGKDLIFVMTVEQLPEVKIMDLKSIAVEKPVADVEQTIIDQALERIALQNGAPADLDSPRASQDGDQVLIDFVGKTDAGEALPGMSATDFPLRLGSGSLIPGFEDQLIGKNIGDVVQVKVTFPAEYHEPKLAGQPATFETTLKSIQAFKTPAIDEDFAKKLGFADLAALRKAVEDQLGRDYTFHSRMKTKRALLDVLDAGHKIDLPASMVDMEYQSIIKQVEAEAHAKAHGDHEHAHDHDHEHHSHLSDEERAELRDIAERRVRLGLVLAEIGRANNITVNEGELQRAMFSEAGRYPGQEKQVIEYFRQNRQALESLRAPIFEEKVVDFILELAKVTEKSVSVEDLLKDDDAEEAAAKADKKPAKKSSKKAESDDAADAEKSAKKTAKKKAE